jgi:hypothetical protein
LNVAPKSPEIGPRGLALLIVAAIAGVLLAVHGWSTRHNGGFTTLGSTQPAQAQSSSPPAHGASTPKPSQAPTAGPAQHTTGPLLSSQSFAPYSFEVWPAKPSQTATAAMTGLSITVHRQGNGISVAAGVKGQPASPAHFYPDGVRVYVIEASMGDDSNNSDYNLGDDGLVVTDSAGRIVQ